MSIWRRERRAGWGWEAGSSRFLTGEGDMETRRQGRAGRGGPADAQRHPGRGGGNSWPSGQREGRECQEEHFARLSPSPALPLTHLCHLVVHDPAPHVSPVRDLTRRTPLDVLLYFLPQLPGLLNGKN